MAPSALNTLPQRRKMWNYQRPSSVSAARTFTFLQSIAAAAFTGNCAPPCACIFLKCPLMPSCSWGRSLFGESGHGRSKIVAAPQEIVTMRSHGAIAASGGGRNHSFAITTNGGVLTWGKVRFNCLGHSPISATLTLFRTNLGNWDMVSAATKWSPFPSKY